MQLVLLGSLDPSSPVLIVTSQSAREDSAMRWGWLLQGFAVQRVANSEPGLAVEAYLGNMQLIHGFDRGAVVLIK